ncbi:AMP-binding protein [Streptomyces boncukensis]|uniref:D-alanine--poly(Phosphoribitol) ligase n=1 Tax=Streptomyces boncukensis TaxID=2711219 RepID=A0A6G4WV13_9ACTN|nr:AMP-binding protein [Streptomyces boncukensis]NGO68692.1 D-alanine--poly(phosphoribitol) ligase [Streptomyces boncukensis]
MHATVRNAPHQRFLRGLDASPRGTALRVGDDTLSYEELHELALRWAGSLLAAPGGPPRAVAVLAGRSVESYAGILAALYCGAAAVPLHPDFPADRTRGMLQASGATAVVADGPGLAALAETELELPVLALRQVDQDGGRRPVLPVGEGHTLAAPCAVRPGDPAYLLFTSGSTGRPKGVPISHGSLDHYFRLMDERYDFTADDAFSQATEVNFDCAMFDLFCAWGAGASVHAVPAQAYLDLPGFAAERKLTVWFSTPSAIALVRRRGGLGPAALPTLRWSFFAGEALLCQDAADWQAAAPGAAVENLYGPTELTITVTGHRWSPADSPRLSVNGVVPIGAVHAGHDWLLRTEDGGTAHTEGELCVAGPQLTAGYLDPQDGEGRFLERDGRVWYRTGDRVRRLENGELAYLGRLDAQVQVQGWRVELAEVDEALRGCPEVTDAATVTRPAAGGGLELVVYYTGTAVSPAVLARQLRQVLPSGLLPRHYEHLEAFPLNANRKVDRKRLAARAADAGA